MGLMLIVIVFFGSCGVLIGHDALTVDGPVRLRWLGQVSQDQAPIVLGALALFCLGLVAAAVIALLRAGDDMRAIRLEDTGITAPANQISRKTVHLPWSTITAVEVKSHGGQTTLALRALDRKLVIAKSALKPSTAFDDLVAEVHARVGQAAP